MTFQKVCNDYSLFEKIWMPTAIIMAQQPVLATLTVINGQKTPAHLYVTSSNDEDLTDLVRTIKDTDVAHFTPETGFRVWNISIDRDLVEALQQRGVTQALVHVEVRPGNPDSDYIISVDREGFLRKSPEDHFHKHAHEYDLSSGGHQRLAYLSSRIAHIESFLNSQFP
jgi:hypothetical protein